MKLSKQAKARIKRMSASEKKQLVKAASLLADEECISHKRWLAISRTCHKY